MRTASRARGPEPSRILSACLAGCTAFPYVPAPAARPRLRPCATGTPRASRARSARRAGHCDPALRCEAGSTPPAAPPTVHLLAAARGRRRQAVAEARSAWGARALPDLEAEDRLSVACERAPTSDPVIASLRAAFQARPNPKPGCGHAGPPGCGSRLAPFSLRSCMRCARPGMLGARVHVRTALYADSQCDLLRDVCVRRSVADTYTFPAGQRAEAEYKRVTDVEKADVVQLGGLHVVGTERHVRPPARRARPCAAPSALMEGRLLKNYSKGLAWLPSLSAGRACGRPASQRARLRARQPVWRRDACIRTGGRCGRELRCGDAGAAPRAGVAAHRQPAARALRAAGRPGQHALLPQPGGHARAPALPAHALPWRQRARLGAPPHAGQAWPLPACADCMC